jgi:hypothetical protein
MQQICSEYATICNINATNKCNERCNINATSAASWYCQGPGYLTRPQLHPIMMTVTRFKLNLSLHTGPHSGTGVIIQLRAVADSLLIAAQCRARSIFQIRLNRHSSTAVECQCPSLAPLTRIWPSTTMTGSIVVQMVHAGDGAHQFAVLNIALIRDCLMDWVLTH